MQKKGSKVYEGLTYTLTSWDVKTLLFLAQYMPDYYVLTTAIVRATGLPMLSWGTIHCLLAAISVHDAYNGYILSSWAHGASLWNDAIVNDYTLGLATISLRVGMPVNSAWASYLKVRVCQRM